jgi:hypothetical protein
MIRGICDYADSHKNEMWHKYAAATATAYAKELLTIIPSLEVENTRIIRETVHAKKGGILALLRDTLLMTLNSQIALNDPISTE